MVSSSLSAADVDAVLAAAETLGGARSLEVLRERTVTVMGGLVASTLIAWNEVDLAGRRIDAVMSPPLDPSGGGDRERHLGEAFMAHVGDHPVIAHYRRTGDGRPYAISDFLSTKAFHATGIYRHFYRYLGAEDQISFVLPDPRLVVGIALNRPRRDFTARDRRVCNLVRPYLVQAYRNVEALARVQQMLTSVEHLVEDQRGALVLLNPRGDIEHVSIAAARLLGRFFGTSDAARLPEDISTWVRRTRGVSGSAGPLVCWRGTSRLVVRRVPTDDGDALLLVEQPDTATTGRARRLGLTARESEVLGLVAKGLPTKRIATLLEISPRTVDKHVGQILDKLGVRSRLGAVALVSQTAHEADALPGGVRPRGKSSNPSVWPR